MYQIVEFLLRTTNETQLKSLLPGLILILLSLHLIKFDAGYHGNSPRKEKQSVISKTKNHHKKFEVTK
jgi:hypothetical protein